MYWIISWLTTPIFGIALYGSFLVFHVLQIIALRVFGYQAHKVVMDGQLWVVIKALLLVGSRFRVRGMRRFPTDRPLIIVSNHQSIFDIPYVGYTFRRHHPKFIAKKELGKGIPSVSYHLKYGGNVLIDRNNKEQSLATIAQMGEYIQKHTRSVIIYAEGTRSRDGSIKPFKEAGIIKLLERAPSALIVPVAIENAWQLIRYKYMPIPFGIRTYLHVCEAIEPAGMSAKDIVRLCEERVRIALRQPSIQMPAQEV